MNDFHKGDPEKLVGQIVEARREDGTLHATGKAVSYESYPSMLIEVGGDEVLRWPAHMVVLADDPGKDPVGTVRQSKHGALAIRLEPKDKVFDKRYGVSITGTPWDCDEIGDDWQIIGAVAGTPAAEAQTPISVMLRMPGETDAPAKREPVVCRADHEAGIVEEPPAWVDTVEDKHGDCLRRKDDGWIGYGGDGYPVMVKPWANHVLPKYAPYSEVRS